MHIWSLSGVPWSDCRDWQGQSHSHKGSVTWTSAHFILSFFWIFCICSHSTPRPGKKLLSAHSGANRSLLFELPFGTCRRFFLWHSIVSSRRFSCPSCCVLDRWKLFYTPRQDKLNDSMTISDCITVATHTVHEVDYLGNDLAYWFCSMNYASKCSCGQNMDNNIHFSFTNSMVLQVQR